MKVREKIDIILSNLESLPNVEEETNEEIEKSIEGVKPIVIPNSK